MRTLFRCGLLVTVVAAVSAQAATRTWIAANGVWSNPANWQGGVAPVAGDDLVFPAHIPTYSATNDYPAGTAFQSISIPHIVNSLVSLPGNAIVLGAGGLTSNAQPSIHLPVTLGADQTWSFRGEITQTMNLNGQDLSIAAGSFVEWEGVVGTGTITATDSYLTFYSASTTTAPLTLTGGGAGINAAYPGAIVRNAGATDGGVSISNCAATGPVTMNAGGFTSRCAQTGTFTLAPAVTLIAQISPVNQAVSVTGAVTLGNAELGLAEPDPLFTPAVGATFTVIANDGVDPVIGTFAGLPEGTVIRQPYQDSYFRISYHGGTGNDVVLTAIEQQSATFLVTNLNDSGPGSLRQALLDANATPGNDTVIFQAGLAGTITLTSGEIDVTEDVDVVGPAAGGITVSGNLASRIFDIVAETVRISNLGFTAGRAAEGGAINARTALLELMNVTMTNNAALSGDGGALRVELNFDAGLLPPVTLRIGNSVFTGNQAQNGDGGAIFAQTTDAVMDDLTLTGNQAGDRGGAMHVEVDPGFIFSELRLTGSLVSGNESCRRAQTFLCGGGGISIRGANLVEHHAGGRIIASTIENNTATVANGGLGGGVLCSNMSGFAPCVVDHSTVNGNHAAAGGGAYGLTSRLFVVESTVVSNTATGNGGGIFGGFDVILDGATVAANSAGGNGGGVYFEHFGDPSFTEVTNSIVADNTPNDAGTAPAVTVPVTYSLIENPGTASLAPGAGYLTGVDPLLGPLQTDPGSPTATRDPAPGSPVINTGDPAESGGTDQRYYPRVFGGRIDMGAVEVQPAPAISADVRVATSATGPFIAAQPVSYTISVTNAGPSPASPTLTETLPAGAQLLGVSSTHGSCSGTAVITCTLGTLLPDATAVVTVDLRFPAPGTYASTSSVIAPESDPAPANNSATTTFTAAASGAPQFDLSVGQTAILSNERLFFNITVANAGPAPAPDVLVTDVLPPGTTFVAATPSQGSCTLAGNHLTCTLGDLAAGTSATIALELIPPETGSVSNTVTASSLGAGGDANAANNSSTETINLDAAAANIPTWSEWAQLLAAMGLALAGWIALRR